MGDWADDPEIVATFAAEVDERVSSLQAGLLQLEETRYPRQATTVLLRDAHAVKGAARLLGRSYVVTLAHSMEDVLSALLDARLELRRDVVDLMLMAAGAIADGVSHPDDAAVRTRLATLSDCLATALREPAALPVIPRPSGPPREPRTPDADEVIRLALVPLGRVL